MPYSSYMTTASLDTGTPVRAALAEAGLNARQLSRLTNLPYQGLLKKLSGKSEFSFSDLLCISQALDVDPASLIPTSLAVSEECE